MNFFFALVGLPIFFALTTYTGEIKLLSDIWHMEDLSYRFSCLTLICISGISGIMITLSLLMVCTIAAPIAINVTGVIKDVALTYIGFIFFKANISFLV